MKVLYEDNHLLVVDKPAGIATMGAEAGAATVHDWATHYIKEKYNKPGNVFVGIVSRLDAMTSGVLVLARTSKAASRLSIQFGGPGKNKKVKKPARKTYLAIVSGGPFGTSGLADSGTLIDRVFKDESQQRMRTTTGARADAKVAKLHYVTLKQVLDRTLVAVQLQTGRKHQIRLQFADRGHPVLGDKKYGSGESFPVGVALHSWRLLITHPTKETEMEFVAKPPDSWTTTCRWIPDAIPPVEFS